MTINLQKPDITELKPRITVYGVGGGGGNAVNNMITGGLEGVDFVVANTDAQALTMSKAERVVQMGIEVTEGLGAGSQPEVGRAAAEECLTEITDHLAGTNMAFVTAGMGGGTGTGAAPVVARAAREMGILTVGVVTKPFHFEGQRRMRIADAGISELQKNVDTLIVIPNQNLFRIANDKTTFADAFGMADQVLYSGVACITDLMVKEGLINLDFADVRSVMNEMGKAMMGTGEASGEGRAIQAAEAAISNPLLDESSMLGAQGLLISITGGRDMTLFEVDESATRIREEVDADANIILGATFDEKLEGTIRVSVVATGIDGEIMRQEEVSDVPKPAKNSRQNMQVNSPAQNLQRQEGAEMSGAIDQIERAANSLGTDADTASREARIEKKGIRIEPFQLQDSVFSDSAAEEEFRNALEEELMPKDANFVPPIAEIADQTLITPTIPDARNFPPIARAEMEAKDKPSLSGSDDRGAMGLLKKLKSGFGAQMEDDNKPLASESFEEKIDPVSLTGQHANVRPQPMQHSNPQAAKDLQSTELSPQAQAIAPQNSDDGQLSGENRSDNAADAIPARAANTQSQPSPYAPKRNGLDENGRIITPQKTASEDEQLDIPAFLRRQSS